MGDQISDQGFPKRRRKLIPWRKDPVILARLPLVERRHLAGDTNVAIAAALDVDEGTIRNDLKRLQEVWLERIQHEQQALRAGVVAELGDIRRRALRAAEFDEAAERAVLFNERPFWMPEEEPADDDAENGEDDGEDDGEDEGKPKYPRQYVRRDDKGSAQFRGNKAAALNVARQATMDVAKVLGVVVEKQEVQGEVTVRRYIGVDVNDV